MNIKISNLKFIAYSGLILFWPTPGLAKTQFSLSDCVKLALENNRQIKIYQEIKNVKEGDVKIAWSEFLPQSEGNIGYKQQRRKNYATHKLDQQLRAVLQGSGITANNNVVTEVDPENWSLQFKNKYDLFAGLGHYYSLKKENESTKAARVDINITKAETIIKVSETFYDILNLKSKIKLFEKLIQVNQQQKNNAQKRFQAEDIDLTALIQSEEELLETEIALSQLKQNLVVAQQLLNSYLGRPLSDEVELKSPPLEIFDPFSAQRYLNLAIRQNPTLRKQQFLIKEAQYQKAASLTKHLFVPKIQVENAFEWEGEGIRKREDLIPNWYVGFKMTIPFFDGFKNSGENQKAQANLESTKINARAVQDEILIKTQQIYYELVTLNQKSQLYAKRISSSLENFRKIKKSYLDKAAIYSEYLAAEARLLQAQIEHQENKYNFQIKFLTLRKLIGELG